MSRIVFVTGTDTETGKTFISRAIGGLLARKGTSVIAVKPVESGVDGDWEEDGKLLAMATGQAWPTEALQRLKTPVAPPVAAELENHQLDTDSWSSTIDELAETCDTLLVEGAGGLLSPLDWNCTLLDLAIRHQASMVVVARDFLGVIGRVSLVLRVLENAGLKVLAVFLNQTDADVSCNTNHQSLTRLFPDIPIVAIPRCQSPEQIHRHIEPLLPVLK
jgi:dethiobiotin synthetase